MPILSSYINSWLYKDKGYYASQNLSSLNIGFKGDFYTSSSISRFFGGAIARYIIRLLEEEKLELPLNIVEIGSNCASLISCIAQFISAFSAEVFNQSSFFTIEPLENLRSIQEQTFFKEVTSKFSIKKLEILPSLKKLKSLEHNCFFISNELFDSLTCELYKDDKILFINNNTPIFKDIKSSFLKSYVKSYVPYECKSNPSLLQIGAINFIHSFTSASRHLRYYFLSFDYGLNAYRDSSLRMYKNHQVFNFLENIDNLASFYKKSDITYDVDFRVLIDYFKLFNAKLEFFHTQAKTLIDECKILEVFEDFKSSLPRATFLKEQTNLSNLLISLGERFFGICFKH